MGIEEKDQACEYKHEDVFGKLRPSAPEQVVDESRRRIEYDAVAVWKATATVCQTSEPYRVSNHNHDHTSESDVVRDGENDLHLFDELVDISRDNVQAESGQDGYLNLESRAGLVHHTLLLPPFRVSSPIENAGINTSTKFAAESGFLNGMFAVFLFCHLLLLTKENVESIRIKMSLTACPPFFFTGAPHEISSSW